MFTICTIIIISFIIIIIIIIILFDILLYEIIDTTIWLRGPEIVLCRADDSNSQIVSNEWSWFHFGLAKQ